MAAALFAKIDAVLKTPNGTAAAKKVNDIITYEFPDTQKTFVMDLKAPRAYEGKVDEPACSFKMDESVFLELASGKADPMGLFMEGKIEIDGDTDIAQKMGKVLKTAMKDIKM